MIKRAVIMREFQCPKCGSIITASKKAGMATGTGHTKRMWCYKCKKKRTFIQLDKYGRRKEENMSGEAMPFEQQDYIDRLQQYCLEATNMTESEAYNFAFRCWQLNMDNPKIRNPRKEFLTFLGRGSCYNVAKEGSTSAFYRIGVSLLLIDCGETTFSDLLKHKDILIGVETISILITHMHSDHIGSLPSLIYYATFVLKAKVFILSADNDRIYNALNAMMYLEMEEYERVSKNISCLESKSDIRVTGNDKESDTIDGSYNFRNPKVVSSTMIKLPGFNNPSLYVIPVKENHVIKSTGYIITKVKDGISTTCYYSGDTKAANLADVETQPFPIDFYYLDAADRGPDYPHQSIENIKELDIDLHKVRLIHIDSISVLEKAKKYELKPVNVLGRDQGYWN